MHYIYTIQSKKDGRLYIGYTTNIAKRIKEHNYGKSKSTKAYAPWKLAYYEAYFSKNDALKRERMLKTYGRTLGGLKRRLEDSINTN